MIENEKVVTMQSYVRHPYREHADQMLPVPIVTSKNLAIRALCVIDAFIKRVEKIGGSVQIKEGRWYWGRWNVDTTVFFGGEAVSAIRVREKYTPIRVPANKDQ